MCVFPIHWESLLHFKLKCNIIIIISMNYR
nr:MAG TPA: hypothetical protein [Caudoviricetes sp.]